MWMTEQETKSSAAGEKHLPPGLEGRRHNHGRSLGIVEGCCKAYNVQPDMVTSIINTRKLGFSSHWPQPSAPRVCAPIICLSTETAYLQRGRLRQPLQPRSGGGRGVGAPGRNGATGGLRCLCWHRGGRGSGTAGTPLGSS